MKKILMIIVILILGGNVLFAGTKLKKDFSVETSSVNYYCSAKSNLFVADTTKFPDYPNIIDGHYILKVLYPEQIKSRVITTHFPWNGGNPSFSTWIIYFDAAKLNGVTLHAGDEIAIYDGTTLVGASTLSDDPHPNNFQQYVIAYSKLANGSPGYTPGNSFTLKCWDSSTQSESVTFIANFYNPFGDAYTPPPDIFPSGFQQYSIASAQFEVIDCPNSFEICSNEPPINLTLLTGGLPVGGNYSGDCVIANWFYPAGCTIGTHLITYTYTSPFTGTSYNCSFYITVRPSPIAVCPIFSPMCEGDPPIIFPPIPGGIYHDCSSGSLVTGFNPVLEGSYCFTLTVTNSYGCSDQCNFNIIVSPLPIVNINTAVSVTICEGSYFDFNGLVNAYNYLDINWFTTNGTGYFDDENILEPIYYPSPSDYLIGCINIYVAVSAEAPCILSSVDSLILCFQMMPVVNAGADGTFCEGANPIQLNAYATNFVSVFWKGGSGTFSNQNIPNPTYTPGSADFGSVISLCVDALPISPCGVSATDCMDLVVSSNPIFTCPAYGPYCAGAAAFSFTEPGVFKDASSNVVTGFNPTTAGTFTFTYTETNEFGCSSSCGFSIVVHPLPVFTCPAYGPYCAGTAAFSFTEPGVFKDASSNVVTGFNPTTAGTFTFTYTETNEFGCSSSCGFSIVVNQIPTVNAGTDATVYCGQSYTFSGANATNFSSLEWTTSGDGTFSNITLLVPVYHPGTSDCSTGTVTLCLTAVAKEGCLAKTDCMTLTINPNPIPIGKIMPDCIRLSLLPGEDYIREIVISNEINSVASLDFSITEVQDVSCITEVPVPWLNLDKTSGKVAPGAKSIVYLAINAMGLLPNIYCTVLHISTNDPNLGTVSIPVTLTVITAADTVNCQRIPIPRGWSWISSYIQPVVPTMEKVFENQVICKTMVILVSTTGVFWPPQNVNTIGNFTPYLGYKILMNVNDQLIVCGQPVVNATVNIIKGINYLPVLSPCPVESQDIFNQINNVLIFAYDSETGRVWWPGGGLYSLNTLLPGRGYLLSTTNPGQITYPECNGDKMDMVQPYEGIDTDQRVESTGSQHIVSIYSSALTHFNNGDVIVAYNQDGRCVGRAIIEDKSQNLGLILQGDDFYTEAIDGMIENEPIQLKLLKNNSPEEYNLDFEFDNSSPNSLPVFVVHGLSKITRLSLTSNVNDIECSIPEVRIFPNPAKNEIGVTLVSESVREFSLKICNIEGKLINTMKINQKNTQINISHLKPGVYILRFEIEGTNINKRLIKQ